MNIITRAWTRLAPKLVAFFATGFTATMLIALLHLVGLPLEPGFAALLVAIVASAAGYIKRDNLLELPWNAAAPKLIVFTLTSVTSAGLLAFLDYIGISLDPVIAGLLVTALGGLAAYFKHDETLTDAGTHEPGSAATTTTLQ